MTAKLTTFVTVLLVAARVAAAAQPGQPSFDCSKASGEVEKLVCADAQLAALDRRMAEVYEQAAKGWPAAERDGQKALQRGWIKGRNECWKESDKRACVERSYRTRIVELQIRAGLFLAPTAAGYRCAGEEGKPLSVVFYGESDPPSAVITFGTDQVMAFVARSGSGARYTAPNVEFWEHQGEATLDWYGTKVACKVVGGASATGAPAGPGGFDRVLTLRGITFRVTCANDSSAPTLRIVPAGLEIDNSPITREVDGSVVGAEIGDLNVDGSPEIYVYVQSAGSGSYGSIAAYAANNRKSLSEIYLPPVAEDPKASKGYMGHDAFAVVENTFVQRFPVYRQGDTNANPTGGTRQLQYKLVPGEAGWRLRLDRVVDY